MLALAGAGSGSALPPPPSLHLASRQPLVVRGAHFRAFEQITVTVLVLPRRVKRVEASREGSFGVSFDRVLIGRCGALGIRAAGSKGSTAVLKIPLFACSAA